VNNQDGLGHFVVLHRIKKNAVIVADAARGIEKLDRQTFSKAWTGYLLLLEPQEDLTVADDPHDDAHDGQTTDQRVEPKAMIRPGAGLCHY